jgi:hypothetical protein
MGDMMYVISKRLVEMIYVMSPIAVVMPPGCRKDKYALTEEAQALLQATGAPCITSAPR